ncbi:MAG: T9SS type A sorting domain-containing protein, partial [Flavobacteriales bacterium]
IDFVNPNDTTEVVPVCQFGFNNPINTEIDYIVVRFYDINDNLIHTHNSVSPELVNINLYPNGAAYVTMEDENDSAYVIDDIWFEAGCPANVDENKISQLLVYPNPTEGVVSIDPQNNWVSSLMIFDISGRKVKQLTVNTSVSFQLNIHELSAGIYFIRDEKNFVTAVVTKY